MQLIISAFPGSGKSTIFKNAEQYGLVRCDVYKNEDGEVEFHIPDLKPGDIPIYDLDSSHFSEEGFLHKYITYIKDTMERHNRVIIMVSSDIAVRNAMSGAGIKYRLVYPRRELKEEFIQRYMDRGSPEEFVTMMENNWDSFIDSCEKDATFDGWVSVLNSGQGIADVMGPVIESLVINTKKTLEKVLLKNSVMEKIYESSKLKELLANAKLDSQVIQETILVSKEELHAGMESVDLLQRHLECSKQYARETYGIEIEASIAGVESFMDQLRTVLKKAKDMLKSQPDKQGLMQIKRSITDCNKAVKLYGSESWLKSQTFKDGGEVTINTVPGGLDKVRNISELARVVNPYISNIENTSKTLEKEARAKLVAGLKIWNKFKNSTEDTFIVGKEIKSALEDVKLPQETLLDKDKIAGSLNGASTKGVRIPVLDKAGVEEAVKIISSIIEQWFEVCNRSLDVAEDALSWDDLYDSKVFSELHDNDDDAISDLMDLVEWETLNEPQGKLEMDLEQRLIPVAQMLEHWILYSVE